MGGAVGNMGGVEVDDPELAEAIRMSLQESQANQNQNPQNQADQGGQREQTEEELEALAIRLSL